MKRIHTFGYLVTWAVLLGTVVLLGAEPAQKAPGKRPAERATSQALGGANRYLTHLATDKPIYRIGETVYVRGTVLHGLDHTPLKKGQAASPMIEVRGPKGAVVASGRTRVADSVAGFSWKIPDGQAGGEYTVKMSFPWQGFPPAERTFDIRAYRAPRLKSQVTFLRDGYGPGDRVTATLETERAEGGVPAGAEVTVYARVDGAQVWKGPATVSVEGRCTVSFDLPKKIERGEGTLAFAIADGGVVETAAKTLPILLQTVDVQLFPEGGDLVAGLPARVYLEAKTPAQKPADIAGVLCTLDEAGEPRPGDGPVVRFRTEHEGRGRFAFTPRAGMRYALQITEPAGISKVYPLPAVKADGAVLSAVADRTASGDPVQLRVGATAAGDYHLTLCKREKEVAFQPLQLAAGAVQTVGLKPLDGEGVLIATLWSEDKVPLAERLVFVAPAGQVRVTVEPERLGYVPGDTVSLTVRTSNRAGEPVPAVVGLTVTDDSVLEMIETREQAPRLPAMALLESEVEELGDAHVYLDPEIAQARRALDLLLGTQGWRRFAFVRVSEFLEQNGDDARRVLALTMETKREEMDAAEVGGWGAAAEEAKMVPMAGVADAPDDEENEGAVGQPDAPRPVGAARKNMAEALDRKAVEEERARLAPAVQAAIPAPPVRFAVIREYAHKARPGRKPGDRRDFTETLYWAAGVKTDDKGEATVSFDLSDSVTTFRVLADAFTQGGALGAGTRTVESVEPFHIQPKLPLEVTAGDMIRLPVAFVNAVGSDLDGAALDVTAPEGLTVSGIKPFGLAGDARVRRILEIEVSDAAKVADLVLAAKAGPYADKVTRSLAITPRGFPIEEGSGGLLGPNAPFDKTVVIPDNVRPNSLTAKAVVCPTPLANMQEALQRLLREPHGCFEQTSSTNYPVVMAQQYFQSHTGVEPQLVRRGQQLLDKGYKKLVSFECDKKGYEWFGSDPGHEALTAYGLLEFHDMAQVHQVDPKMLTRTREWLLARRDGKGGFARNKKALDSFGRAPDATTNAYITWALVEAGEQDVDKEVAAVRESALKSEDSYVQALAANTLLKQDEAAPAKTLLGRLAKKQAKDGHVPGAETSITRSGGDALKVETTALSVLAWLQDPDRKHAGEVEKAVRFLAESCKGGRYGSTQSTVLALRAIVAYDRSRARPKAPGALQVLVDGKPAGAPVAFDKDTQGAIELPDFSDTLTPGTHKISVEMENGSEMPFSFSVAYHSEKPATHPDCKLGLTATLRDETLTEGAVTELAVTVSNRADEVVTTPVAILGVPGGLEPRHDQLKELVKAGRIAAYEVRGRDVVIYWRALKAGEEVSFPISLVAAVPGVYTGPASRVYLYYTDEHKTWGDGLTVDIQPRGE